MKLASGLLTIILYYLVSNKTGLRAQCYVTCIGKKIKDVTEENIPKKILYKNFDILKRSKWFDEHCQEPNIKVLARLIGDIRCRFQVTIQKLLNL